jgi:tape measure domain-containing protein
MANNSSAIVFRLQADATRMKAQLDSAQRGLERYRSRATAVGSQIQSVMASMFSIYAVAAFGRAQFDLVKKLDSTNKALQAVAGSSEEYNRSKLMLSDTTEKYGANLLDLTAQYTKFRAATKSSKLATSEIDAIFQKVTKSAGVLGLSAEQTEGAFKALEQMFSKGTIQAEEIRGQLSERLPGAFNILAESMGITTAELGKLLKEGKVLADDVLPKFADQLLIAYGADKVERVETLVAAQNRLKNSWVEFVESIESGEGRISKALIGIFDGLAKIVKYVDKGEFWKDFESSSKDALGAAEKLFKNIRDPKLDAKKWTKVYISDLEDALSALGKSSGDMTETLRADLLVLQKQLAKYAESLIQVQNPTARQKEEIIRLSGAMAELESVLTRQTKSEREHAEALQAAADAAKNKTEAVTNLVKAEEKRKLVTPNLQSIRPDIAGMLGGAMSIPELQSGMEYDPESDPLYQYLMAQRDHLLMIQEGIQNIMAQMATDMIEGLVTNLVMGKNPFQGLLDILGDGLIQLGKFLIVHSTVMEGIKKALANPFGAGGFIIGVAAIAAGAALKKAAAGANAGMAGGGGSGGGSRGGRSFQGNEFGGQSVAVNGQFTIKGKDLVYVLDQNKKQDLRAKSNF